MSEIKTIKGTMSASNQLKLATNKFDSGLLSMLGVLAAISTIMVGISAKNTWNVYQNFQSTISKNFELQHLSGQIVHLDEVLTMSARMAASTGNLTWEERYLKNVISLDKAISKVLTIAPEHKANASQTDAANTKLIEMEEGAFRLVRQGKAPEALKLLLSLEYVAQKQIYSEGIEATLVNIQKYVEAQIELYTKQLFRSTVLAGVNFIILVVSWILVLMLLRNYISRLNQIQLALEEVNQNLEEQLKEKQKNPQRKKY